MIGFKDVLDKYRKNALSKSDYGTKFEELMAGFLQTYPLYDGLFRKVYLWRDFPYKDQFGSGHDVGIDLVAETESDFWAVQCKMYDDGRPVSKADLDSFMSASSKTFIDSDGNRRMFSNRLLIATTDNLGENARAMMQNQIPPVSTLMYRSLVDAEVDWEALENNIHGKKARRPRHQLRPHQQEALDKALAYYSENDRGKLIMACGTGKTFTSLRIMEALHDKNVGEKKGCILFLAPSISLVGQTMREWMANTALPLAPICVCSDPKASKNDDTTEDSTAYIEYPATTDPQKIVQRYRETERTVVIFSTYQSLGCIIEAQSIGIPEFDFIVCDEAHRTTGAMKGDDSSYYTDVHDNSKVHGKLRMYMTATPRIYGEAGKAKAQSQSVVLYSMDDEKIYGREIYRYSFGKAVDEDMLCDYRVIVLTMDENTIPPQIARMVGELPEGEYSDYCRIWGCLNAMMKHVAHDDTITGPPMKSAVAFTSRISDSRLLASEFNKISSIPHVPTQVEARHIDGTMDAAKRDQLLNWLREADDVPRILTNVRCLSEGVDVPALDAVMFFGTKTSMIDIIQSVGRVMRKAPEKEYGYIIIPVIVNSEDTPEDVLDNNLQFKQVWSVLRALRAHDDRIVAEVNTIMLTKSKRSKHILIGKGRTDGGWDGPLPDDGGSGWDTTLDGFIEAFYGRLVTKVGEKDYIENWAARMGEIAPTLRECLERVCLPEGRENPHFQEYLNKIRSVINSNVSEKEAIDMLMQQYVTKPIFNKLFGDNGAVSKNSVFNSIDKMMRSIDVEDGLSSIKDEMDEFYRNVENTLDFIDTAEGKQKTIKALYEKFFKRAFGKEQEKNGIVYTPGEIVDFILRSVDDVLRSEFEKSLSSEGVNILDPFTGTGTFIAHLIGSGLIKKEDLERKYAKELYANEITLIAYYIATVNIENAFAIAMGRDDSPDFDNILLTDTFNIDFLVRFTADQQHTIEGTAPFERNKLRIRRENAQQITVIIGNPPYGANQKRANDNAKKRKYDTKVGLDGKDFPTVDQRIRETYLDDSFFIDGKGNVNSVYNNYIRAYRWATDRLRGDEGVIAFVTPNAWLTGGAFIGFRKVIEKEFDSIYIYSLRGDATTSGEMRRNEGDGVFADGSRVGICIMMLVRHRGHSGKAKIRYIQTEDGMKRLAKLESLNEYDSFIKMRNRMEILVPQENGDWIVNRNSIYMTLIPMAGDKHKKFDSHNEETIFVGYSNGQKTNRDSWDYNFDRNEQESRSKWMISEFNKFKTDGQKNSSFAWNDTQMKKARTAKTSESFNDEDLVISNYRPFCKIWYYSNKLFTERVYQMPRIYPHGQKNLTICVSGTGLKKDFSCLMTDALTDLEIVGKSQCFPLYWYEPNIERKSEQRSMIDFGGEVQSNGLIRHDGISDWALNKAKCKYGAEITKEDLFYYVYGYLHSRDYREAFSEDLKFELPRIGLVRNYSDFVAFSEAGRKLAKLHLEYESVPAWKGLIVNGTIPFESFSVSDEAFKVGTKKMKIDQNNGTIQYNNLITIGGIPEKAFEYVVNGRSALASIAETYYNDPHTDAGIVNDPNEYAGGKYIFNLIGSIVTVSVETVRIQDSLPRLVFGDE